MGITHPWGDSPPWRPARAIATHDLAPSAARATMGAWRLGADGIFRRCAERYLPPRAEGSIRRRADDRLQLRGSSTGTQMTYVLTFLGGTAGAAVMTLLI